ncbi:hypothetical protein F2Q68_00031220 [Brassica cretica]|uniref:Uncharacterized protein n=1 Tax=Brassica cretica TaxID=69181 RepID=A0A8S9G2H6_BRACR|nr:hypothetical protein F2Q68_00031220 [Brassica cretica]
MSRKEVSGRRPGTVGLQRIFHSFWYEERLQVSRIKEALRKANVVAYALWRGKFAFDIEKDLKNHEAKL